MTELVDASEIVYKVGQERHARIHYGRAVSDGQTFYILHSENCLEQNPDLRDCDFSVALDNGLPLNLWKNYEDQAVVLSIVDGRLWPGPVAGMMRVGTHES